MTKIDNYKDLITERNRLKLLIESKKQSIKDDFLMIEDSLKPGLKVISKVSDFASRGKNNPLINLGLDVGVDLILKKFLLAKTGWITRLVLPFIVKNYSSNLIRKARHES